MSQMRINELKYIILDYLYKNRNKKVNKRKIFFANNLDASINEKFNKSLDMVKRTPYVVTSEDTLQWNDEYFIGKLYVNGAHFTYRNKDKFRLTINEDWYPLDGDTIIVKIDDEKRLTGTIHCVIKRTSKSIRGILTKCGEHNFVIPEDRNRYRHDIHVEGMLDEVENYAKVELKLDEFSVTKKPNGVVERVIRSSLADNDKNKAASLAKYGFSKKFSAEVLEAANKIKQRISYSTYNEKILVEEPVFIISNSYYSDFAFSASKNKVGYTITVFIPDVTSKIPDGSILEKTAKEKAIACKLNDEYIDILPTGMLNDKIRFVEAAKRPAIAFKIHYDINGHQDDFDVFEAIVTPCKAINSFELFQYLKYRDEVFENNYYSIIDDIFALVDIYQLMRKDVLVFHSTNRIERVENGRIVYNGHNMMDDLTYLFGMECEKIVGYIFMEAKFPCIHSYYELPSMFNIEKLNNHCIPHGINAMQSLINDKLNASDICEFINSVYNQDIQRAIATNINNMIGVKQYSKEPMYNFKAGAITCPIVEPTKNYAAIYNHRLLKRYIHKRLFNDNVFDTVSKNIDEVCNHMTAKHKAKKQLESEYLNSLLVEVFSSEENIQDVLVFGISPSGLNVELVSGMKGLVRFDDYTLSDKQFTFIHNNVKDTIVIGDKITVAFSHYDVKYNRLIFQYIGRTNKKTDIKQ